MYTFLNSCRNPLKRSVGLVPTYVFANANKFSRPLMMNAHWYGKNKGENGKGKEPPTDPKKLGDKLGGSTKDSNSATGLLNIHIAPIPNIIKDYEERNKKLGRHLSPHLSIYKIQLTSLMSIMLRITGFMLGFGIWTIGLSGLFFNININDLANQIESWGCSSAFFTTLKFCIFLPFAYHMVAGTRHLVWYLNVFLSKKEIYATGYLAALLTLLLAASLASIDIHADQGTSSDVVHSEAHQILLDEDGDSATRDNSEDCYDEHEDEQECICQDEKESDAR